MKTQIINILIIVFIFPSLVFAVEGWTIAQITEQVRAECVVDTSQIVQMSGKYVVWQQNDGNDWEIFYYDGNSVTQVTDNNDDDRLMWNLETSNPGQNISGKNIVWFRQSYYPGREDIYFYDGNCVTQLTNNAAGQFSRDPKISGTYVTWKTDDCENGTTKLFSANMVSPASCEEAISMGQKITGDINEDCQIDMYDLTLLSKNWLRCNDPNNPSCDETWE